MKTAVDMTVADAMHHGVVTCDVDTPLSKVAQMMVGHGIHCVVVSSRTERELPPLGVVSDLDLAAAFRHDGVADTAAGEVAATPAVMVGMREPLGRAVQLMTEHGVSHLVVIDRGSSRPVGVLSTLDVARAVADA